jgi:hypothetical protein
LNNVRSTGTYYPAFISATANGNYALNSSTAFSANLANGGLTATTFVGNVIGNLSKSDGTNFVTTITPSTVAGAYFGSTAAVSYDVSLERYRGNITTFTEVSNGDQLGEISFRGWDGFSPNTAASITSIVDAAYTSGSGSAPGAIVFNTANAAQGGVPTEKMRVASTGNVGIANTNPGHTLSITGTLNASGNANVGNLGTGRVIATGNISGTQLISNIAIGTAPFVVTSTTQVANLSVATAGSATTAGTVTTAAQPNITSVGTLTGLTISTATGRIGLSTDSGGALSLGLVDGNSSSPYIDFNTSNTAVDYNVRLAATGPSAGVGAGNLYANAAIVAIGNALTVGTTANITGNANVGNLGTTGNISAGNVTVTGYNLRSVGTGISANGTTQAQATAITKEMNIVSTVLSTQGVVLPTAIAGMVLTITNTSANALLVYPAVNGIINSQSANAAYSHPAGATLQFIAPTTTQWYTVGATYA